MSSHDQDDLMPRPLPKPSQVEVISVRPEVPEPSLIIDKFYSQTKHNGYVPNSFKSSISNLSPSRGRNVFAQNYDSIPHKSTEIPISTTSYSPPALQNQADHIGCRKVSFSSLSSDSDRPKSNNPIDKSYDYRNSLKPESCSCQYSPELRSDLQNDLKLHSPICTDFRKIHRTDYEYSPQNDVCNRKRCSCSDCRKEYFEGVTKEKQNYISTEELQKTVLKFENLFLKLNYKYSKITENFVSKEELSAVTRSYEAKIDSMQAVIDAMISRNKIDHCMFCNQPNPSYRPQEAKNPVAKNPVTTKSNSPVRAEQCDLLRSNNCNRSIIPESKSNDGFDGTICDRKREDMCSYEPQIYQSKGVESPKYTAFENQRRSPSDVFWNPRRNGYNKELVIRDHLPVTRPKEHSDPQDHSRTVPVENKSKSVESNGHLELEKETLVRNLKDDQQVQFLYNNIITQVKSMLEKNISVGVYGKTDPLQFVKEATVEQFEKMGLNVKNIVDEDKERHFPRIHSRENEEAKRMSAPKPNAIPSSDVSLHMNALAMKYISNYQKDENDFAEKKSATNDVSVNCNNVSIATLRYLERHQILSELDKPHAGFGANEIASSTQRFHVKESDQNIDRSFIS